MVDVEKAVRMNSDSARAHLDLGVVYLEEGRFDKAIVAFKKAIAVGENFIQAYTCLGVAYIKQDRATEAIAALRRAIGIDPNSAETYYYLADAFSMKDERTSSLESLQTAMSLDGSYMVASQRGDKIWGKTRSCESKNSLTVFRPGDGSSHKHKCQENLMSRFSTAARLSPLLTRRGL